MHDVLLLMGYPVLGFIGLASLVKAHNSPDGKGVPSLSLRDVIYICGYFVLIVIGVLTFYYGGNKEIVDHIGFAGTISSLLLSVIAIIYAVYQGGSTYFHTQKLTETSEKISAASRDLGKTSLDFEAAVTDLRRAQNDLGTAIGTVAVAADSLTSIRQDVLSVKEQFSDFLQKGTGGNQNIPPLAVTDTDFSSLLKNTSTAGIVILSLCIRHRTYGQADKRLEELVQEYNSHLGSAAPQVPYHYAYGFLIGMTAASPYFWFREGKPFEFEVRVTPPEKFGESVASEFQRRLDSKKRGEQFKQFQKALFAMYPDPSIGSEDEDSE